MWSSLFVTWTSQIFFNWKKKTSTFCVGHGNYLRALNQTEITKKSRKVMRFAPRYHFELKDEMFCLTVPMTSVSLLADVTMASQWDSSDQKPTSINLNRVCATKTPQILKKIQPMVVTAMGKNIEWSLDRAFLFETMSCWKKCKLD